MFPKASETSFGSLVNNFRKLRKGNTEASKKSLFNKKNKYFLTSSPFPHLPNNFIINLLVVKSEKVTFFYEIKKTGEALNCFARDYKVEPYGVILRSNSEFPRTDRRYPSHHRCCSLPILLFGEVPCYDSLRLTLYPRSNTSAGS